MDFGFNRKRIKEGVQAPSFDPFGRFKNTGTGLFGFRKDKHVIIPGVTAYEEMRLQGVKRYVEEKTGKPCTLSQELINDVYGIYVNENVKRRPMNNDNQLRHKILDSVYDSLTKIVTENSPLYTNILSRELALALQVIDDEMKEEQQKQNEKGNGDGQEEGLESSGSSAGNDGDGDESEESQGDGQEDGEGNSGKGQGGSDGEEKDSDSKSEGNNSEGGKNAGNGTGGNRTSEDILDKLLKKHERNIEIAKKDADDKIEELENQLGKEAMKDLMNENPEFLEEIDKLKEALKSVSFNKESIKKILEKILDESMNYFSPKFKRVEESLFDCEECEDLFGLEYLHPIFQHSELLSVGNETRIYKGKIDLYIDCSGSMSSHATFEGASIRMSSLAKGIAMLLYRMGLIENLYFFDNSIYEIDNINEVSILAFSKSGGTNFNKVVQKIRENGNNAIILTDGYDNVDEYTKHAFWIGVGGTKFSDKSGQFPAYRKHKQCVAYDSYDGNFIYC